MLNKHPCIALLTALLVVKTVLATQKLKEDNHTTDLIQNYSRSLNAATCKTAFDQLNLMSH